MIEFISQPWPWYMAGPMIAVVMVVLLFFGKSFGLSSNLRTMCTVMGADKVCDFFHFDWKENIWNLVFVLGAIIGGFIAANYLSNPETIDLSASTLASLGDLGFSKPGMEYLPPEIFGKEFALSPYGIFILVLGGFFVGFGARYAGGCTSGHAISGISNLQLPSIVAVIGFFIGGLIMTHLLLPYIF